MIERIKFSRYRDLYKLFKLYMKMFISRIGRADYLWKINFDNPVKKTNKNILIFAPSLTIDKPNYINVRDGAKKLIKIY